MYVRLSKLRIKNVNYSEYLKSAQNMKPDNIAYYFRLIRMTFLRRTATKWSCIWFIKRCMSHEGIWWMALCRTWNECRKLHNLCASPQKERRDILFISAVQFRLEYFCTNNLADVRSVSILDATQPPQSTISNLIRCAAWIGIIGCRNYPLLLSFISQHLHTSTSTPCHCALAVSYYSSCLFASHPTTLLSDLFKKIHTF